MPVLTVTKENFQEKVLEADKTVLIDFWASWCGPCRMVSPIIEEIADETDGKIIAKVNIDEQPELAEAFGVMSIPTLLVLKNGQVTDKSVGAVPKQKILDLLGD